MSDKNKFSTAGISLLGLDTSPSEQDRDKQATVSVAPKRGKDSTDQDKTIPQVKPGIAKVTKDELKEQILVKTTVELSAENNQFIENIKLIEGCSTKIALNNLVDEFRESRGQALNQALEIFRQGQRAWKKAE